MTSSPALRMSIWLLPIVVIVCALMVLPAGSFLGVASASPASSHGNSARVAPTESGFGSTGAPGTPSGTPWHTSPSTLSAKTQSVLTSGSPISMSSARTASQYSAALKQVASQSGIAASGALSALASQIASGKISPSSVYLPDLNLLESGPHSPGQTVGVGYTAEPAPMGIGDFGIGSTPYAYNTSHFAGSLTLNALNATFPGAYYFITPPAATGGSYNSPYYVGVQLNTVTSNISAGGVNDSSYWTQNVVTFNGNWIQFEDNVWNFSSHSGLLEEGSLANYSGTADYPSFYYDYGPAVPLSFPVTLDLFNNVSTLTSGKYSGDDQVTFGYRVVDSHGVYQGVYDTVVFNNPWAPLAPQFTPAFQVNGKTSTPLGLDYDSELIFGGPGGGSNAVINNLSGTEMLQYSNASTGGWHSVPSAYDFGADTGETAIGDAETWSSGGVVGLSAGPSMLYGLWNSQTSTAVPSGSIEYQGTLSPSWGFGFMDNDNPFYFNTSWLPTNANGGFLTYLPPGTYDWYFLADNYNEQFGTITGTTTGQAIDLTATTGFFPAPIYVDGNAQAQAAAAALDGWTSGTINFTGLTVLGDYNPTQFFNHLNDWGYVSWNLFQATGVTDPINVTAVYEGDLALLGAGQNNFYLDGPPIGSPATLLGIEPAFTGSLPAYDGLVAFYSDSHAQLFDEELLGYFGGTQIDPSGYYNLDPAGSAAVLWNDPNAVVNNVLSLDGSYGVWAAASPGLYFNNGAGALGANAVSVVGSSNAVVNDTIGIGSELWTNREGVNQEELPFGVYDDGSTGGTFTNITGEDGGFGFADFFGTGATVTNVIAEGYSINITGNFEFSEGVSLLDAADTTITNVTAYDGGIGVADSLLGGTGSFDTVINGVYGLGSFEDTFAVVLFFSYGTTITNLESEYSFIGGFIEDTEYTSLTNVSIFDDDLAGLVFLGVLNTTFTNTYIADVDVGIEVEDAQNTSFTTTNVTDVEDGVTVEGAENVTVTNFNTTYPVYDLAGMVLEDAVNVTFTNIIGYGAPAVDMEDGAVLSVTQVVGTDYIYGYAVYINNDLSTSPAPVTNVIGSEESGGVEVQYLNNSAITDVTASDYGVGVVIEYSHGDTVTGVTSTMGSWGVEVDYSTGITVSTVSSNDPGIGALFYESSYSSASMVTASNESVGVMVQDSEWVTVSDVTATTMGTGVFGYDSYWTTISDVTASNTTVSSPWAAGTLEFDGEDLPGVGAVVTAHDQIDSISEVTATNYPAAFYDYDSYDPGVNTLNATGGTFAMVLNDTYYGVFTNIGAFKDVVGVQLGDDAEYNVLTESSFVDCASYGVAIVNGYYNLVYLNNFIANNGAGSSFNAAHIQALGFSGDSYYYVNYFDGSEIGLDQGNYWSDWHTYNQYGELAPYPVAGGNWDYYPLGGLEGTIPVFFYESGLASGVTWSVTFNGVTQSTPNTWTAFYVLPGTYSFTVGLVAGYTETPSTGMVTASGSGASEYLTYTPVYSVTVTESGLPTATKWTATVGGQSVNGTTSTLAVTLGPGTYPYQITPVAGYTASPSSGMLTVVNGNYNLVVTFTQVTYAVTITETGLSSGTSWTATISSTTSSYTSTQTSSGTSVTFYVPNGTYTVKVVNVSGYSLTQTTLALTVAGSPAGASVSFSPNATTSVVSTDTFNTWLAVAIAIGVIALVIGLLAMLLRRKKENPPPSTGAQPWTPPAAAGGTTGTEGAAGDSGKWSEGPPAGESPPPS